LSEQHKIAGESLPEETEGSAGGPPREDEDSRPQ
jgi:hypothetical protein